MNTRSFHIPEPARQGSSSLPRDGEPAFHPGIMEVKAPAIRDYGETRQGPSATNAIQTNQTEQINSHSNSRIKSGQETL